MLPALVFLAPAEAHCQPRFHAIALYENGGHHVAYSARARAWLNQLALDSNFTIDYIQSVDSINEKFLSRYQLFIQLDFPPYGWKPEAARAFEQYIDEGHGGWVGLHHASLLGEFDGYPAWDWFINFMGGIRFKDYIAGFADGTVKTESPTHPVMKGVPGSFVIDKEEWYTYDRSPGSTMQVLASVDENSYRPGSAVKMGDHPVVWTNPKKSARNVYIFMGHAPALFDNASYTTLLKNAITWASQPARLPVIHVNQVGFDVGYSKLALVSTYEMSGEPQVVNLVDVATGKKVLALKPGEAMVVADWDSRLFNYPIDFTAFNKPGKYYLTVRSHGIETRSATFSIGRDLLAKETISSIVGYYRRQRANTPMELKVDSVMKLYGSAQTVDVRGGWCDASGDISKYFSHLAYANYFSPQQTPLVTWSLINTSETIPGKLREWNIKDSLDEEATWGADYLVRSLSKDDYFYMIVFSYFNKDPNARRIVGLHANSVTTNEYQCSFREGGGMAIAALARISKWNKHGTFTSKQYLEAAERAFAHLLIHNLEYDDDHQANIIDDYCALMAASELWISTGKPTYLNAARGFAASLEKRMTKQGWFRSNGSARPFYHASDAGLPVLALSRYLKLEKDVRLRLQAIAIIDRSLRRQLQITNDTPNPFGYARQDFAFNGKLRTGFFIPHENETGWWWQGENARLASLATAALSAARLQDNNSLNSELKKFATDQLSWILGNNPYSICFLYGYGEHNVPYMASMYGHGSEKGGISNGITGADGHGDGSGIDFKREAGGDEWRWTEQWIPHAAWFLQAVTAMTAD